MNKKFGTYLPKFIFKGKKGNLGGEKETRGVDKEFFDCFWGSFLDLAAQACGLIARPSIWSIFCRSDHSSFLGDVKKISFLNLAGF
jgi:hypothetical protein